MKKKVRVRVALWMAVAVFLLSFAINTEKVYAASANGDDIVEMARRYKGKVPYKLGADNIDGPNPQADCSGFICRIYEKFGFDLWDNRVTLRYCGTNLGTDLSCAQPGDILWFEGHVGIYSGKNSSGQHMVIHECGGSYSNVVETRATTAAVGAKLLGIIRIPGVTTDEDKIQLWGINNGDTIRGEQKIWAKRIDDDLNHYAVFYLNGEELTGYLTADADGFFSCLVDSSWYNDGTYLLSVKYFNSEGQWTDSIDVNFERKVLLWGVEENKEIDSAQKIFAKRFDDDNNHYAQFFVDDKEITGYLTADNNDLFSCILDPQKYEEGVHRIKVKYANTSNFWTSTRNIIIKRTKYASQVSLNCSELTLNKDKTAELIMSVTPTDFVDKVTWSSSDTEVATVSQTGIVTAKKVGSTIIHLKVGNVSAYCNVTVTQPVEEIGLSEYTMRLNNNENRILVATISPSDANNKVVSWSSSDTSVATVDASGMVTAVGKGEATITAEAEDGSGVCASCKVTVKQPVNALSLNKCVLMLNKSDSYQLISEIEPSDADNKSVIWRSSNTSVATVDASGLVTALEKGKAIITVTSVDDPGFSLTCEVTVKQPVTSLSLDKNALTLNNTDGYILTATAKPTDADNKLVSWSSSNTSVATVNDSGFVRAVGRGEAIITATAKDGSGVNASCKVTVKQQVTWLDLNVNELTLNKSENYPLIATVTPSNANNKTVSWSSSNTSVATVDANGLVKAVGKGEATITAAATDGSGVMVQCKVKVTEQIPEPAYRFADVSEGTWQYNVAKHAVEVELMKGKSNTADGLIIFDPNNNMTRAEFVQTLYNKEGKPAVNYTATFKDVPAGQWYTNAILWAAQNNIVAGKGENFDVSGNITRQEMATILYKYATNFKRYETAGRTGFDGYVDAGSISNWATENMKWAIHYGIMKGQGNKLAPQANATRAECAAMLKNFMDIYE